MSSTLQRLVERFSLQEIPRDEWTHSAHLAVGAWHVNQFGPEQAIARLRTGIRLLNDRHGTINSPNSGYHETITIAYARLIDQFLAACDPATPLGDRVELLLSGPFAERSFLLRFWSREVLMSPAARFAWTPPDIVPLVLPADAMPPRT
jgi:hypothetical protein